MDTEKHQANSNKEHLRPFMWKKGQSGNILGRPKGKTMKEWAKEYLERMTDEERDEFMEGIPKEVIWKMSEGNPETKNEVKITEAPAPILGAITKQENAGSN